VWCLTAAEWSSTRERWWNLNNFSPPQVDPRWRFQELSVWMRPIVLYSRSYAVDDAGVRLEGGGKRFE